MLEGLLTYIVRNLVASPERVLVSEFLRNDGEILLELQVAPEDMGKVIGRRGRIAKELRTLMRAIARKDGKRASIEIRETGSKL